MESIDEADLRRALVEDLDVGFAKVVRCYQRIVYSVALRVSGRPEEAEDLSSECFLNAFKALRGYDSQRIEELEPRPWLLTILLNSWRNRLRSASRRPHEVAMTDSQDCCSPHPGADHGVGQLDLREIMARELSLLPPAQRSAVVLRHVVGMTVPEVAQVLHCPEGTAKSHISRGLRALRESSSARSGSLAELADRLPRPVLARQRSDF